MFFEHTIQARVRDAELKKMERIVEKNFEIETTSHLMRIAIMKLLQEYDQLGNLKNDSD